MLMLELLRCEAEQTVTLQENNLRLISWLISEVSAIIFNPRFLCMPKKR